MNTTETALHPMNDDELAELLATTSDDDLIVSIVSEMDAREKSAKRKAAQTARDKARWARVYDEWVNAAHAQYLQAEAICCGNLVHKSALDDVRDPFALWTGSEEWAMRVCSEEMRDFWALHPRQTVSQFRAGLRAAKRDAREMYAPAA